MVSIHSSCSRKCKRCSYSKCKNRRSRKIGKCEYFCKYIFCCGCCFDKLGKQHQKRRPPKITRVEHVDYLKNRSGSSKHRKITTELKKETDIYFSTASNFITRWPYNQRQWTYKPALATTDEFKHFQTIPNEGNNLMNGSYNINSNSTDINMPTYNTHVFGQTHIASSKKTPTLKMKKTKNLLGNIFFSCLRSKRRKGATQRNIQCKENLFPITTCIQIKSDIPIKLHDTQSLVETTKDANCHHSINSTQSLEINSQILTRSASRVSSLDSILSLKWRRRFRRYSKKPSTLQVMCIFVKRMRHNKSKNTVKHKKHNVIVLHVPKKFSNTSTIGTMSIARNSTKSVVRVEKPLIIKDYSLHETVGVKPVTKLRDKLCGPGEVIVKKDLNNILKLKESGRVRHVGVSNVNEEQLRRLSNINKPACLQIEVHVLCQQESLVAASKKLGVPVVAYSPLGSKALADTLAAKTGREYPDLLTLPKVKSIAEAHGRTTGQILLRYTVQRGIAIIPKSTNPERIKQNISLWDFELSESEMKDLAALDRGENGRICDFTFFAGVEKHPEFPFKK